MPRREELEQYWGVDPGAGPRGDGFIGRSVADPSLQATVPFDPLRPRQEAPVDPWSSRGGTLSRSEIGDSISYPPANEAPVVKKSGGPAGCFLGFLAFLIICAVAGFFGWEVAKPLVSHRVADQLNQGLATQVASISVPTAEVAAGKFTLTEAEINKELAGYAGAYDPVTNPRVRVLNDELRVDFDLYGVTSTYRGGLAVNNGRIVVVNPDLSGPAGQVMDASDVATILETQLATVLDRSHVRPVAVQLRTGEMTVTTKKA